MHAHTHWLEILEEVGMKPVVNGNVPLAVVSSIALTVPPILHSTIDRYIYQHNNNIITTQAK